MKASEFRRLRVPLILLGFITFALFVSGTMARNQDDPPHAALARLQTHANGELVAHFNARTNVPDFVHSTNSKGRIPYTPNAAEHGNPSAIARGFLDENRDLFQLTSVADNLTLLRVEPDAQLGYAHVRMSQTYHGIPVFGKQLIVHIDKSEQIVAVNGDYLPAINVATKPTISKEDAERVALQDLMDQQLVEYERNTVSTEVLREQTQLMVYVDEKDKATLTWNVIIMTDSPLGQWTYFVNAGRPAIVHAFDSVEHIKQRKTYTANNTTSIPGRLLIDEGQRSNTDTVAQAAQDNAGKTYDYYLNTFKRDSIDGNGMTIVSTVHYGSSAEDSQNAAWISQKQQMVYGDGGRIFQPLALGLDVAAHELTHGVTDSTAQLIYQGQSGALNESYSDVFGAMVDRSNWLIGETVIKSPPFPVPYLRNMEDPSSGGRYDASNPLQSVGQPSNMREYANLPFTRKADNGGVHVNSGIPNRVAFLIAQAIGREKTEQIYYRTLTQILSPSSDFLAAAQGTMQAAQDLYGAAEVSAVSSAWQQVGLDVGGNSPQNNPTPPGRTPSPTPSKGKTQPTPPPQTQGGCTNIIANGGFESTGGWVEVTSNSSIIDSELPHAGQRSAWLGGQDKEGLQYIYQDVNIPANANSVKLNYWRLIHEEKKKTNQQVDDAKFWTVLARTNGDVLQTVEQFVSSQGDDNWVQSSFDISQFAGKTVRVAYIASNPQNNISSYFVDDVELLSCTSGQPQDTPPTSGNNVFVTGIIKNADTGRGIEGGQFIILKEGLSATDAAADDNVSDDEVLTFGVSDAKGIYQTNDAIAAGKTYSVIVIAQGYRPIVADDALKIPASQPNPFKINATMRSNR